MNLFGLVVSKAVGWVLLIVLSVLLFVAYMYVIRFIRRYASGMVGGFLLILGGLALILGPTFYMLGSEGLPVANVWLSCVSIFTGCISFLVGAYELSSFGDF